MTAKVSGAAPGTPGKSWPRVGSRPWLGLWPNTPQKWAGTRIEPPMSEPSSSATMPAASAAAAPPDDPPGVRFGSSGCEVRP